MIYGYKRPSGVSFTLSGGDSPAFQTDVRLDNSQPSEQTIISGIDSSSPDVANYIDIICEWANPQAIGIVGLLNISAPQGTKIEVDAKREGDAGYTNILGGNSRGSVKSISNERLQFVCVCDNNFTDIVGVRIRILNDAGGATWANDTTDLGIGEIALYASTRLCAKPERNRTRSQRADRERAYNGALHVFPRGDYRSQTFTVLASIAEAYKNALIGNVDIARLQAMQDARLYRAMIIPRGLDDYGSSPDYDLIQEVALFCMVKWGQIQEEVGMMRVNASLEIEESP